MNCPDFSHYVVHFTKGDAPHGIQYSNDHILKKIEKKNAFERLNDILTKKKIRAFPMPFTGKNAVAFTECSFWSLLDHIKRYSNYGIGFAKEFVFNNEGGPVFYIRQDVFKKMKNKPDPSIYPFLTPFMPKYASKEMKEDWKNSHKNGPDDLDYTHEREWRIPKDLTFDLKDIQFVIVKSYEDVKTLDSAIVNEIGADKFLIIDVYRQIEKLWPTHQI